MPKDGRLKGVAVRFIGTSSDTQPGATFHHATAHDGVQFLYCKAQDKGIWFLPKKGMGPMQPRGRAILKQIVEGR